MISFIPKLLRNKSLSILPLNNFCIYEAYLNPTRHITMSHNVNNIYEDLFMLGDVALPIRTNDPQICR